MTDNEIIKALECCSNRTDRYCPNCPYYNVPYKDDKTCSEMLVSDVLDLITRQQAEIEGLHKKVDELSEVLSDSIRIRYKEAKSEAIKEFAEKLEYFVLNEDIEVVEPKCKDYESYIDGANQFRHQIKNGINNLVKEMTGKNDFKE